MEKNSEKNRLILADIVAQAWNDAKFKQKLIEKPKEILQKAGVVGIAADTAIRVLENTANRKHIVLPGTESTNAIVSGIDDYFRKITPLPAGLELVFVQNSDKLNHIVLPVRPPVGNVQLDSSHSQVLAAAGWEAINLYTTANAVAEANAAAVQNVAAATEAAAAAVAVAVIGVVLI